MFDQSFGAMSQEVGLEQQASTPESASRNTVSMGAGRRREAAVIGWVFKW